jgi:uncharacterized protein
MHFLLDPGFRRGDVSSREDLTMKRSIFGLAAVILTSLVISAGAKEKADPDARTLTIQGQGKASAVPDVAVLSIEVSADGVELDPPMIDVRRKINKILDVAKAQAIAEKDIRTDLFQVRPKYEQDKRGNPNKVGYIVTNRISVKVRDLKKTGKILSSVIAAGATTVNGPSFEIDNPAVVEKEALAAATGDAKAKAQTVAEAAGVQLGGILSINPQAVNWPGPPRPLYRAMAAAPMMDSAQEPIASGEQTLSAYVTITFAIR